MEFDEQGMNHEKQITSYNESDSIRRDAIRTAPTGYFFIDRQGLFQDVNDAWLQMHGYSSREEIIGQPFSITQTDTDTTESNKVINKLLGGKSTCSGESVRHCRDGAIGHNSYTYAAIQSDGEIVGLAGFLVDLEERKTAEHDLMTERRRYRDFLNNVDFGVVVHATDTSILFSNRRALELLGMTMDQMMGKTTQSSQWKFVNETGGDISLEDYPINRVVDTGSKLEHYLVGIERSGLNHIVWVVCNGLPVLDDHGNIDHVIISFVDITELKRSKEDHAKLEKKQRAMIENISDVLAIMDRDGIIRYKSPNIEKYFGWRPEDLVGKPGWETVYPEDMRAIQKEFVHLLQTDRAATRVEYRYLCKDKSFRWIELTAKNLVQDPDINGVLVNYHDITERKNAERREKELQERLTRVERMKSLGILAGGVAHDLNNILGPMVMLPDIILEDVRQAVSEDHALLADISKGVDVIKTSADRAVVVVRDLMTLSRGGQYDRIQTDINCLECFSMDSSSIRDLIENHSQIRIDFNIAEEPLVVSAAEEHLCRVVDNLIRNAAESIHDRGTVTVTTGKKTLIQEHYGYIVVPPGIYATVTISDTGEGMSPEYLGRIFEPFFTKKKKSHRSGSGLGLSVVHGIVCDHDGLLDIETELGVGTTFTLYLPLVNGAVPDNSSVDHKVLCGREKVLIVDDEPCQRFLAIKSMQTLGYTVDAAEDGDSAIQLFKESQQEEKPAPFDLVILDMIMGDGYDGLETLREIQKLYPKQRVVIASGHADNNRSNEAKALGAKWLAKPYRLTDLGIAMRAALDE